MPIATTIFVTYLSDVIISLNYDIMTVKPGQWIIVLRYRKFGASKYHIQDHEIHLSFYQGPLLLTRFNFNPSMNE